jgi:hypothetical protein
MAAVCRKPQRRGSTTLVRQSTRLRELLIGTSSLFISSSRS